MQWIVVFPQVSGCPNINCVTLVRAENKNAALQAFAKYHGWPECASPSFDDMYIENHMRVFRDGRLTVGAAWEDAAYDFDSLWVEWNLPTKFNLDLIVRADKVVVLDQYGKRMGAGSISTLEDGEANIKQGKWLSDAGRYSRNPEGETGGPSGLCFL